MYGGGLLGTSRPVAQGVVVVVLVCTWIVMSSFLTGLLEVSIIDDHRNLRGIVRRRYRNPASYIM
jgi:hypothetical protein